MSDHASQSITVRRMIAEIMSNIAASWGLYPQPDSQPIKVYEVMGLLMLSDTVQEVGQKGARWCLEPEGLKLIWTEPGRGQVIFQEQNDTILLEIEATIGGPLPGKVCKIRWDLQLGKALDPYQEFIVYGCTLIDQLLAPVVIAIEASPELMEMLKRSSPNDMHKRVILKTLETYTKEGTTPTVQR